MKDSEDNGKEFGACPQTVIPPTSNRVRTSNFFPLRTCFKIYTLRPWAWLVWNYFDKNKETVHNDGYICITEEIFFQFGFIIEVVLFKSKSPFCNWSWACKELSLYYSLSHSVCVTIKTFWKHYISGSQPNLSSDGGAEVDTISNHSFDFLFSEWKIVWG